MSSSSSPTPPTLSTILQALLTHPSSHHFRDLPSKKDYPDYYTTILNPISLHEIAQKTAEGATQAQVTQMIERMAENAKMYNDEESEVVKDAQTIVVTKLNIQRKARKETRRKKKDHGAKECIRKHYVDRRTMHEIIARRNKASFDK
jgi:hypothetical protein